MTAVSTLSTQGFPTNGKTLKYFVVLAWMRSSLANVNIPADWERLCYIVFSCPTLLTTMFISGDRSIYSPKYNRFLQKLAYPSVDDSWQIAEGCHQFHPGFKSCNAALFTETTSSLKKIFKMYAKLYLFTTVIATAALAGRKPAKKEDSESPRQKTLKLITKYVNQVLHSTAFLYFDILITRLVLCAVARHGSKLGLPVYEYGKTLYFGNMLGASAIVLESDARVSLINRMVLTFLAAELMPGPSQYYLASLLPLLLTKKLSPWVILSSAVTSMLM